MALTRRIPRVYVAGPYTATTKEERRLNVHHASMVASLVLEAGAHPVVPHLVGFETEHIHQPYQWWIDATMAELQTCDACVMVPGWHRSKGSIGKHEDCLQVGRPLFEVEETRVNRRQFRWDLDPEFKIWVAEWLEKAA